MNQEVPMNRLDIYTNGEVDDPDASGPDLDDMLNHAKRLASFMRSNIPFVSHVKDEEQYESKRVGGGEGQDEEDGNSSDDHQFEVMLRRADTLAQQMKQSTAATTIMDIKENKSRLAPENESIDYDLLHKAGRLAGQLRSSDETLQTQSINCANDDDYIKTQLSSNTKAMTVSTCGSTLSEPDHFLQTDLQDHMHAEVFTPQGIVPTVSMDDDEEDVETMLLKADLLSRTIRSAVTGHMDTPELLRASDEILKRAKRQEGPALVETTPQLLERASKIFAHPDSVAVLGDVSDNTVTDSLETEQRSNIVQLPVLLNRPPRPPTALRTPSTTLPITPSPKAQHSKSPDTEGLLEHVISTLQRVPTTKTPDSPVMPKSVALKTLDSDDYSSVGSGSARSQHETDRAFSTPDRVPSMQSLPIDDSSGKSVQEAENLAMEMAKALKETLTDSQSTLPHPDAISPVFSPRKFTTNSSPSNNSQELRKVQTWDEHDAISPRKANFHRISIPSTKIEWETISPVKVHDEDYVPIKDFRKCVSRSIASGVMPEYDENPKNKRSRKTKRTKFFRSLVVFLAISVLGVVTARFFRDYHHPIARDIVAPPEPTSPTSLLSPPDARLESGEVKQASNEPSIIAMPYDEAPPTVVSEKPRRMRVPLSSGDENVVDNSTAAAAAAPPPEVASDADPVEIVPQPNATPVVPVIHVDPSDTIDLIQAVFPMADEVAHGNIPSHCYIPLGYITFPKCRTLLSKTFLFDAQGLIDCMMQ